MTLADVLAYLALWVGAAALLVVLWAAIAAGLRHRRSRP